MPAARGKRGRGRGSARGGAPTQSHDEQPSVTRSGPLSTPPNESNETIVTAPQQALPQSQISHGLSPASPPTETPAPTPTRPPVQRLESLNLNPGGSARGALSRGRIKPRAIRRDKDERDRAEREEQARISARERELRAQGVSIAPPAQRGALGRGLPGRWPNRRGRGDAMGRGRLVASGPFGIAPAAAEKRPMPTRGNLNSGTDTGDTKSTGEGSNTGMTSKSGPRTRASTAAASSDKKVKKEPILLPTFPHDGLYSVDEAINTDGDIKSKAEIPEPVYPEEKNGAKPPPRVDIELINLDSDSDDEPISFNRYKGTECFLSNKGGLKPVRLHRQEHKDRVTTVNTEPAHAELMESAEEEDDDLMIFDEHNDTGPQSDNRGAYSGKKGGDGDQVKYDLESAADAMDIDSELREFPVQLVEDRIKTKLESSRPKARKTSRKGKRPVLQTEEEKAEFIRREHDSNILATELYGLRSGQAKRSNIGQDNDVAEGHPEGRLYLFQFPPILPPLLNPFKVKEEKDDIEMLEVEAVPLQGILKATKSNTSAKVNHPDPEEAVVIKTDPDAAAAMKAPEHFKEAGFIGKLVVRESGKVELNWGGTSFQLSRGAQFDFLTTTMVINRESGASMGSVMGKFVATPDWDKIFDVA